MGDQQIEQTKAALRRAARNRRAAIDPAARNAAALAACQHFLASGLVQSGAVVAAYWSIGDEITCLPIMDALQGSGVSVALPAVTGPDEPLQMRIWRAGVALCDGGFGTLAPPPDAPQAEPEVVIVPLLGYDATGTRLGYGGGFYDRTLASMKKTPRLIGLAYSEQEFAHIPRAPHDVPLDAVVTPVGLRFFGGRA